MKVCRHQVVGGLVGHSRDLPNPRLFLGCLDTVFGAERKDTSPLKFLFIEYIGNEIITKFGRVKDRDDLLDSGLVVMYE